MVWAPKFDAARARAWLMRLACLALVFGAFGSAVGERPANDPAPRDRARQLGLATIPNSTLFAVNRVFFILQDVGEIGSSGSSVAGGGFWKAFQNQYVFSSGPNVGAKLPNGTIVFANGGPFSELNAGSSRFPELDVYWDSQDAADAASFPEVCTVDAARIARFPALASFAGEPFPGFADRTVCIAVNDYLGGTCGECAGTRVGVTIVETIFGFGVPTVQDFVFAMIRVYNDTQYLNSTNSPNQPAGPYTLSDVHVAFAVDPDIGDAGDDQIAFLPDIQTMAFWDHDFTEPQFISPVGFGGIGLVVLPRDPVTNEVLPLAEFTVFTNGAPRPDPPSKEEWYALMEGDPSEVILEVEPRDVRGMVSTVAFELPADAFVEMAAAYFFAETNGAPPADLRAEPYKNLQTGVLNPNANTNPVFDLLREQALVASAAANAGFLQPVAPPSPQFTQIPGDHQITVVWGNVPPTVPNPFGRLVLAPFNADDPQPTGYHLDADDPVFVNGQFTTAGAAGLTGQEVTNVAYNPSFVPFDFEGFRVYRSYTGLSDDAELIAQFDVANENAGGLFCVAAVPVFDSEGMFVTNVCTQTQTISGPGGGGAGDDARFGSNTGLAFSVIDRGGSFPSPANGPGLINGIPVSHAVTSYSVQCGILLPFPAGTDFPETSPPAGCLTLESGKVFKSATPESNPSSLVNATASFAPLKADGTVCDTSEPTATVDENTGRYTDFLDCSNAVYRAVVNPIRGTNIPTADLFLVIDKEDADCDGAPPACYTLATGDASNRIYYHWENADGSPATAMNPQSGFFTQHYGFFHASDTKVAFAFDTDPTDVGADLSLDLTIASDFSEIEDLEVNGKSVHLGELGGVHVGEARPHAVQNSSLADLVNIGMRRGGANAREYCHPSYFCQGGTSYELTWEVSGGNYTGTVTQIPTGTVIPKGGQPKNAENHSTAGNFTAGWNWCIIGPAAPATVRAGVSPPTAGPCAANNTVQLAVGNTFAIYVPGQSVYIEGLKQLPQNGDKWTFLIDTGSQRAFFGRDGEGGGSNAPAPPFVYIDENDGGDTGYLRGIVNVYPGMRWKLSLAGGSNDLADADLNAIAVVPNPFIAANEITRGRGLQKMLFTNLPPVATIRIYTISGNLVRILEHTDGSGTEEYDVRTRFDLLLASGNYYYHVTTPDGRTHLGRFAVVN